MNPERSPYYNTSTTRNGSPENGVEVSASKALVKTKRMLDIEAGFGLEGEDIRGILERMYSQEKKSIMQIGQDLDLGPHLVNSWMRKLLPDIPRRKSSDYWKDAEHRERRLTRMRSPENRKRISDAAKRRWQNPEFRALMRQKQEELWQDPKYRERVKRKKHPEGPIRSFLLQAEEDGLLEDLTQRERSVLSLHWLKGLTLKQIAPIIDLNSVGGVQYVENRAFGKILSQLTEEQKSQIQRLLANKWQDSELKSRLSRIKKEKSKNPEFKRKMSNIGKVRYENPEYAQRAIQATLNPESKDKRSKSIKEKWQDPKFRARNIKARQSPEARKKRERSLKTRQLRGILQRVKSDGFFENLTEVEKMVIVKRWQERQTLRFVGLSMGLTGERIRQIEAKASQKIKGHLQNTGQGIKETSLEDAETGLEQLNLLPRTYNALQKSRYSDLTPDEIRKISDDELLAIRGLGRTSLRDLRAQLGQYQEEPVASPLTIRKQPERSMLNRDLIEQMCNEYEWNRQTDNFLKLGFHTELGMTEQDYLNTLPKFGSMPSVYTDKHLGFYEPLLIETRILVKKQFELAGISYTTDEIVEGAFNYPYKSPSNPYTVWTQSIPYEIPFVDHSRDNPKSIEEVRQLIRLSGQYRGATLEEGAAFVINYGIKIRSQFLDLPGVLMTERGTNTEVAPFLSKRSDGTPILHYRPINQRKYDWGGHDPVKIFGRDPGFGALLVAA